MSRVGMLTEEKNFTLREVCSQMPREDDYFYCGFN